MGIQLGLLAALGWGTADFIVRGSTRRIGTMRTLFYVQFIGAISLGVYLFTSGELARLISEIEPQMWLLALLTALLAVGSSILLYRAFEVGIDHQHRFPDCRQLRRDHGHSGTVHWRNADDSSGDWHLCGIVRRHVGIDL